jgi:17 kDa outer membrane surface antigen
MRYSKKLRLSLLFFMLPLQGCGVTLSLPSFWNSEPEKPITTASTPKKLILVRENEEVITPEQPSDDDLKTGSIVPRVAVERFQPTYLRGEDWLHVKAALYQASESKETFPSVAYENAQTGTFGTVTIMKLLPLHCRSFLGSSVFSKEEFWFEGKLCKNKNGEWELTTLDTLKKKG